MAIRDPYIVYQAGQFPCLADYGEMVNPTIALVGFPGKRLFLIIVQSVLREAQLCCSFHSF